jgi:hypothetical protein
MSARTEIPLRTYEFTLIAVGLEELSDEQVEAIGAAGCLDCLCGSSEGKVDFIFGREARSLEAAIGSAILDLKKAGVAAWLESIEEPEPVSTGEIGDARAAM